MCVCVCVCVCGLTIGDSLVPYPEQCIMVSELGHQIIWCGNLGRSPGRIINSFIDMNACLSAFFLIGFK